MVLKRIVEDKRLELDRKYPGRELPPISAIEKSDRSFEEALKKPHMGYVFECKKASPSKGLIRADFKPVQIAKAYAPFADAISVLTDEKYFQGSLAYLTAVRNAVEVPVLCKDFILEPFQVIQARMAGADAVLLMMSVLSDEEYARCYKTAQELQMDVLTEVRNREEMQRALNLGVRIIGINNRNLDNLQVDLKVTEDLAPLVPEDKVVISESGISTHEDVVRLGSLVHGFLVGSSLMAQADITRACGELVYGRMKVCGLTENADAQAVKAAGVYYGGLIFAPGSKRVITVEQARQVQAGVDLAWVGVFVNESVDVVANISTELRLSAIQLHGDENDEYIRSLRTALREDVEIWKAISVTDTLPPLMHRESDRMVFDGKEGGSGEPFRWSLLQQVEMNRHILAGGIGPQNVKEASRLGAFALDVNSKIEYAPGKKDPERLRVLLQNLRSK